MKIDDPIDDLKKAAHEAGLSWGTGRKLCESKDKLKLSRQDLITKTARGQACLAAMEWATKNVSGFEELRMMTPDPTNYAMIRRTIHVVESFVEAAMSRCEVEQT